MLHALLIKDVSQLLNLLSFVLSEMKIEVNEPFIVIFIHTWLLSTVNSAQVKVA